jgi:hypothetical protein
VNCEDIIKKLENTELPEIELKRHRQWLRTALLDVGSTKRQSIGTFVISIRGALKGITDIIERGLFSRQPVWKTALSSALVLALVLTFSLILPSLSTDSVYAQAVDIIKNSPEIQAAIGDDEPRGIQVLADDGESVTLLFSSNVGLFTTEVNLKSGRVIYVSRLPELTEAERQAAIKISEADPMVKELLDKGAIILRVSPRYYDYVVEQEIIQVVVEKDEEIWFALIDMEGERVLSFMKLQ